MRVDWIVVDQVARCAYMRLDSAWRIPEVCESHTMAVDDKKSFGKGVDKCAELPQRLLIRSGCIPNEHLRRLVP